MSGVYYNEWDPFACAWLRELIGAGLLPDGEVDDRSVLNVESGDLGPFRQCHFFAGIGGWPRALGLAGCSDLECWTASLPCQPLSVAGERRGDADERHLWPAFYALIAERRPATIFGEQVASKDGREWLAGVRADLEELGYACGAANLPACAVGAPHRRERLYWCAVADAGERTRERQSGSFSGAEAQERRQDWPQHGDLSERPADGGDDGGAGLLADAGQLPEGRPAGRGEAQGGGAGLSFSECQDLCGARWRGEGRATAEPGRAGFWDDAEWRIGADGKARRVKPGVRLLAHGVPNRVGALRGFGNAIVPQVAAAFIRAFADL